MLQRITIHHISEKFKKENNRQLRNKSDYTVLKLDIDKASKSTLSLNTVKRLMGVLKSSEKSRPETLDIIANYLGYQFWENYAKEYNLLDDANLKLNPILADKPQESISSEELLEPDSKGALLKEVKEEEQMEANIRTAPKSIKKSVFHLEEPPVLYLNEFKYSTDVFRRKWPLFIKQFDYSVESSGEPNVEFTLEEAHKALVAESKTYRLINENVTATKARKKLLSLITFLTGIVAFVLGYYKPDYAIVMGSVSVCSLLAVGYQLIALNSYLNASYYWSAVVWNYYYNIKEIEENGVDKK